MKGMMLRKILYKPEVYEFVHEYLHSDKPFNAVNALLKARPDLASCRKQDIAKYSEKMLANPKVQQIISNEMERFLRKHGVRNTRDRAAKLLVEAEKISRKTNNAKELHNLALTYLKMSGEVGQTVKTGLEMEETSGKLTEEEKDRLDQTRRIKLTQEVSNG